MKGHHKLLIALLALQLVLILIFWGKESDQITNGETGTFITFNPDEITGITIVDGEGESLAIHKNNDQWLANSLPSDQAKINELFEKLIGFNAAWPVATTADVQKRFEVSDDKFQRHLTLEADGKTVADLYFGTSPGFQQVHVRLSDANEIYSVKFSNFELSLKGDDWLDKALLRPSVPITAMEWVDHWTLRRSDEGWLLDGSGAGNEAVTKLLDRWRTLNVVGIVDEPGPEKARFNLTTESGVVEYRLFHAEAADRYGLSTPKFDQIFEIPGFIAEQMMLSRDTLRPVLSTSVEETTADLVDETLEKLSDGAETP